MVKVEARMVHVYLQRVGARLPSLRHLGKTVLLLGGSGALEMRLTRCCLPKPVHCITDLATACKKATFAISEQLFSKLQRERLHMMMAGSRVISFYQGEGIE